MTAMIPYDILKIQMSIEIMLYDKKKDAYIDMLDPENGFSSLQILKYIQEEIASQRIDQTSLNRITIIIACDVCGIGPNIFEKFSVDSPADAQGVKNEIRKEMKILKRAIKGREYGEELPLKLNCKNCLQQSKATQN
jgi:hypothetical protein